MFFLPLRRSIVIQDRADAAVLGEYRRVGIAEQVQVERFVRLLLAVTLDFDGDGLRRLAGGEGQRAGVERAGGAASWVGKRARQELLHSSSACVESKSSP